MNLDVGKTPAIVDCKVCGAEVESTVEFIKQNGRLFCGNCCKAFPVDNIKIRSTDENDDFGTFTDVVRFA